MYDQKDCDDDTKHDRLIIILHALPVAQVSIFPLSHTYMHMPLFYRVVQLHIRNAK